MRALLAAVLALAALTPPANADWTSHPGQGLEGGDALYCAAPCDVYGVRNIHSERLDIAAGNSNLAAGPFMAGQITFCFDITCTVSVDNGHGCPLVQVAPTHTDFRAPDCRLLMRLSNRGIVLYAEPRIRR